MSLFKQLKRSFKKSKFMKASIKEESKIYNYDHNKSQQARKALYNYLCEDQLLSELIQQFTYEQFDDSISRLKALGFTYSKKLDYVPIAAFCFAIPLSYAISFFIKEEISLNDYTMMLIAYFGELAY